MTETNMINETNEPKSVPTPLLSEELKASLLANLTNLDEHYVQLFANREDASLANTTKTDFQCIASTVHSLLDTTNHLTLEMTKLYYQNETAYRTKMAHIEAQQADYNFKVLGQLVKELGPSLYHSNALANAKVVCSALKLALQTIDFARPFTSIEPAFENFMGLASKLCVNIVAIDNVYDGNVLRIDNAFSKISELIADPLALFNPLPGHEDL